MEVLRTEGLKKYYGSPDSPARQVKALDGVSFGVQRGEFVAVVGTSGSGKSTLLHMLGGLDRPTEGKVYVEGKDIFSLKDDALTIFRRRKIGFVFQAFNLVPVLSVYENIVLPLELDGNPVDEAYVGQVIAFLGLKDRQDSMPGQLSGGQQQRVAIARALAAKPAILLADEPTGNLDSRTSQNVVSLLKVTGQKFHQTIVMITHNEAIAQMADRIIRIEDGKISQAAAQGALAGNLGFGQLPGIGESPGTAVQKRLSGMEEPTGTAAQKQQPGVRESTGAGSQKQQPGVRGSAGDSRLGQFPGVEAPGKGRSRERGKGYAKGTE
ncbi:MAG: ABC transporter ATP-binding protein [Lachnospiraceae bacterium]|jgi:putative ABC transport system ATP-binding protein|nr:ABC transporter ATP-binding protein [Lachnospiraceae bacterium]